MNEQQSNFMAEDIWNRAKIIYLSTLQKAEEKSQAENYFSMITSVLIDDNKFVISTSNKYAADFLTENYAEKLKSAIELAGCSREIPLIFVFDEKSRHSFSISREEPPKPSSETHNISVDSASLIYNLPLEENYTFAEFVQGPSNSWAYAAARGVANNPGKKDTNPLFIHGGTGLGKTHLMQAIGNYIRKNYPKLSICYLTAEMFLNEYVNSVMNKNMNSFRNQFRNIDVLLIDDIQFLQKGKQCQEEFFNTFNYLTTKHKQIVMTSDVAPKNLPTLEERLISRFEGGMVQEIEAPNYETRLAILKKKAANLIPTVPTSALEFLANNIKSHVRAMEGALAKVHIASSTNPTQELSSDFLSLLLKDFIEKEQSLKKLTIREIQECVAKKYGVSLSQILSSDRTQSLVTPRQMAMYISRKYTPKSLQEIASEFDKKHATIIHGARTIQKRLDVEEDLRKNLDEVLAELGYNISDTME